MVLCFVVLKEFMMNRTRFIWYQCGKHKVEQSKPLDLRVDFMVLNFVALLSDQSGAKTLRLTEQE